GRPARARRSPSGRRRPAPSGVRQSGGRSAAWGTVRRGQGREGAHGGRIRVRETAALLGKRRAGTGADGRRAQEVALPKRFSTWAPVGGGSVGFTLPRGGGG